MHRKMSGRAALAAAALAISCTLATAWSAAPAEAAAGSGSCSGSSGGSSGGGSGSGGDYEIWQALSYHGNMCSSGGNASSSDGTGGASVHIPCYWGPEYSPEGLRGYVDSLGQSAIDTQFALMQYYDVNGDPAALETGYQSTDGPPYQSYNIGARPPGQWWGLILNSGDTTDQIDACMKTMDSKYPGYYFWGVDQKRPPNLPTGVPGFTARDLAEYIESVVVLPGAKVQSSQGAGTHATVDLPIWYWQIENTKNTSLGFDVCAFGVCVTFNAVAVSFTIDAGATGGQAWSSGCTPQSTNTLGKVYTNESASQNPTCGVKYSALATGVRPTVNTKWHVRISWTSNGGGSWSPPADPVIPTRLNPFAVQDIQAYNQPSPTGKP